MRPYRLPFFALLLLMAVVPMACESDLSAPESLSLEVMNAMDVLPADARVIAHMDVQQLQRNTLMAPFGEGRFSLEEMSGEGAARLNDFLEQTGFDPEEDLRNVYFTFDEKEETASLVVYANYDAERLSSYVEEQLGDDLRSDDYRGVKVYQGHEGHDGAFALVNDNMMIAAPRVEEVHAMIDRLSGDGRALADDREAMDLIKTVDGGDSWFIARDLDMDMGEDCDEAIECDVAQVGRAVRHLTMSVNVAADGIEAEAALLPQSGVAADDVAALLRGVVAAMKLRPEVAGKQAEMLEDIDIRSRSEKVVVRFGADNETLRSM